MKVAKAISPAIKLIERLDDAEAKVPGDSFLVVGFPDKSTAVHSSEPDRLEIVEKLLHEGGIPVAILNVQLLSGGQPRYFTYMLDECAKTSWAKPYIDAFVAAVMDIVQDLTITVGTRAFMVD
jgi:hypothetical protein